MASVTSNALDRLSANVGDLIARGERATRDFRRYAGDPASRANARYAGLQRLEARAPPGPGLMGAEELPIRFGRVAQRQDAVMFPRRTRERGIPGVIDARVLRFCNDEEHQGSVKAGLNRRSCWTASPDLSPPAITKVAPPALQGEAAAALASVRKATLSTGAAVPGRLETATERDLRRLAHRIKDTPTEALLTAAGWSAEGQTERRRKAMAESRDRQDAARAAEMARLDDWLGSQLKDGPVPKGAVLEAAAKEAIPEHGPDVDLTLRGAADRLGVFGALRDGESGTVYWSITRLPEGFVRVRSSTSTAMR
jgi:hypothetical protein